VLLTLQETITYGPVNSRRLGSSLGINILPPAQKACTLNCLYCQYGWGDPFDEKIQENLSFPPVHHVMEAVKESLKSLNNLPRYITFSGNGEPTIYPFFAEIVKGITRVRNRFSPSSKIAVLSNSTLVHKKSIRHALSLLDVRIMKLDAGNNKTFKRYSQPGNGIIYENMVKGLKILKNVTIQSLFTSGSMGNYTEKNIEDWVAQIKYISPEFVQIYTLDRDSPCAALSPLEKRNLLFIKELLQKENIHAEVY
jgi:wyosine [tRNA(Phe)-imidazoG37] synthetase (radical SAM superfamily)